jgi:DinB superfamily
LSQLSRKFESLEKSRSDLTTYLHSVEVNALSFKINENKWSTIQLCFHVIKSEQLTIFSLNKNLKSKDKLRKSGSAAIVRNALLSFVLKSKIKIKAPALVANMPEDYDFKELMGKWEIIRSSLKEFLDYFPKQYLNKEIFRHPYAGWLNISQTLNFLQNHFDHHKVQIIKLIEEYKSLN